MKPGWKERWPALGLHNGRLTSEETPDYNCLAFAAGKTDEWWEPYVIPPEQPGIYWPQGVHPDNRPEDWAAALATVGFEPCADGSLEPGCEKVAIYVDSKGDATHAARQLPDGRWASKLGIFDDIEHDDLNALEGSFYLRCASHLAAPPPDLLRGLRRRRARLLRSQTRNIEAGIARDSPEEPGNWFPRS